VNFSDYMDRFLDEMDNPLLDAHASSQSSVDIASIALCRESGSPINVPTSSLERASTARSQIPSTPEPASEKVKKPRVSSPSGRSASCKKVCEDGSSACSPDNRHVPTGCELVESSSALERQVAQDTCSIPKDPCSIVDTDSAIESSGTLPSKSVEAPSVSNANIVDVLSDDNVTVSVMNGATCEKLESLEPTKTDVTNQLRLVTEVVAGSNVDSAPMTTSTAVCCSIASTDADDDHKLIGSCLKKLDSNSIEQDVCTKPVSEAVDSVIVVSSSLMVGNSVDVLDSVASVTERLVLPAPAVTQPNDVISSIQSKELPECPTLSADLTDIAVETLVPPVDLTGVDPMDVSIDTLVPLVDHPDSTEIDTGVAGENTKEDCEGPLAMGTFVSFDLVPFSLASSSIDEPAVVLSVKSDIEEKSSKSLIENPNAEPAIQSMGDRKMFFAANKSCRDEDETPSHINSMNTSSGDILLPTSTSGEISELHADGNYQEETKGSSGRGTFVSYGLEPFPSFASSGQLASSNLNQVESSVKSPTVSSPSAVMQSTVSSSAGETLQDCPTVENVLKSVSEPKVESATPVSQCIEQTNRTNVSDSIVSIAENGAASAESSSVLMVTATPTSEIIGTSVSSSDPIALNSDGSMTVVDCPDVRPVDDSRKVPLSTSFAPVLSDCHVGSSLMSS